MKRKGTPNWKPEQLQIAKDMYEDGVDVKYIGIAVSRSKKAVVQKLTKEGVFKARTYTKKVNGVPEDVKRSYIINKPVEEQDNPQLELVDNNGKEFDLVLDEGFNFLPLSLTLNAILIGAFAWITLS